MKKAFKSILDKIIFLFTGKGETVKKYIDADIINYSGQGRNKYGN